MANISSINGNPIVVGTNGIEDGAITGVKLDQDLYGEIEDASDSLFASASTDYNTDAVTGTAISVNRRWFLNGRAYGTIKKVSIRCRLVTNVTVEVWEVDGTTINRVFAKDANLPTQYAFNDVEINYTSSLPMMVSIIADTSNAVYQTTDTTKDYNAYYTADVVSTTIAISNLNTFTGLCVIAYATYKESTLDDIDRRIGTLESMVSGGIKTVSSDGAGEYTSISSAVAAASDGETILVYPGTYTESIEAWGKTIDIIGVDKNTCIITNHTGNYSTPAVEMDSGRIANFTIISDASDPTCMPTDVSNYMLDYSIHADNVHGSGRTLLIENCIIRNDHRAALGIGLYQDNTVIVRDCDIWSGKPPADISNPLWNKRGAVFFHNRSPSAYFSNVTGQLIRFIGNTVYCEDIIAIYIGDTCKDIDMEAQGWVNEATAEFINNMFCAKDASGNYKITSDGISTPTAFAQDSILGGSPFSDNLELSAVSYGNNLDYLNA